MKSIKCSYPMHSSGYLKGKGEENEIYRFCEKGEEGK